MLAKWSQLSFYALTFGTVVAYISYSSTRSALNAHVLSITMISWTIAASLHMYSMWRNFQKPKD